MVDQIDIDKVLQQEGETESGEGVVNSALPGVVRELIRTPAFKELLLIHLRGINPENARELVKAALWEDVAFSMSIMGASPGLINSLAEALVELGVQLNNFTEDILKDFMVQLGRDIDVETIKSIPAAYAPMANKLLLEDREALDGLIAGLGSLAEDMARAAERTWRKIWNTADFGKVRVGISEHLETRRAELEGVPEIFNPIAISNLLGVIPSLANLILRSLTRTLQALDLPGEILANGLFQLLEDIEMQELGGLVNALTGFANNLHRGNLLLGRDEPRLKAVFERVSGNLIDNVDGERFKEMLVAIKEDGAVIGEVISGYLFATPESTVQVVRALYLAIGAALRSVAGTYERFLELPPHALAGIMDAYEEALDVREIGRIANNHATLFNRICEVRPDWVGDSLGKILASLDNEELAKTGRTTLLQVRDAALADPAISAALEPEAVAERINAGLVFFNEFTRENPNLVTDKVSRTLAALDMDEAERAVKEMMWTTFRVLMKNPDILKRALKPIVKPMIAATVAMGGLVGGVLVVRRLRK
jgi:hypothetical protein